MNIRPLLITRGVRLPDPLRVARFLRAPELGPRLLFFSGGSALRPLSRVLKQYTHNSIHLITPFDSGGSSAPLRRAFDMLSVGDLRNRLLALADESVRGNPEIYALLAYRLSQSASQVALEAELRDLVSGVHPLIAAVPDPLHQLVRTHLRFFSECVPADFDLRGANIGNLLLAGGYVANNRDIHSVLFLFTKLLEVRGTVHPAAVQDQHLAATLADGTTLYGQHLLTGKLTDPISSKVEKLFVVDSLTNPRPVDAEASQKAIKWVRRADLLCYPMGSFYTSVLANLLPRGMGRAVADADVPKVYVPNAGHDPEQIGMTLADSVRALLSTLQQDAPDAKPSDLMNVVLIDRQRVRYELELDIAPIEALGIRVVDLQLAEADRAVALDPARLSEALLSLS